MKKLSEIEKIYLRNDLKEFNPGDTVKVHYRIIEGGKERIQIFQGTVIRIKGTGINKTFIVRKISFGIGVERIFPYHSPKVAKIEIIRRGKVRRAKLYYLRERVGKATKVKEKKYIKVDKLEKENPPEEDQPLAEKKIKTKVKEKKHIKAGKLKKSRPEDDQPLAEKSLPKSTKPDRTLARKDKTLAEKTSPKKDQPLAEKNIKDSGKAEKPPAEKKPTEVDQTLAESASKEESSPKDDLPANENQPTVEKNRPEDDQPTAENQPSAEKKKESKDNK